MRLEELMARSQSWRNVRTIIRFGVYAFVIAAILYVPLLLILPRQSSNFDNLSGPQAKRLISWPAHVDPTTVDSVSHESNSSRDSHSTWMRISTSIETAQKWMDEIHSEQESSSIECLHELHEGLEGVHHKINGQPPLNWQTGDTPLWWNPPTMQFRATEVMLWYDGYDSGFGRATYSGYDETTGELWIYEYASQHDILWEPGKRPTGIDFSTVNPPPK